MNWFNRFMAGRYGGDQLSMAFLIISILLTFIGSVTEVSVLTYLGYIPIAICLYRMLSRDITKRRLENDKFNTFMNPVYSWSRKKLSMAKGLKDYRYFKCPYCNAQLRLPKGKGKIQISCPVCKKEFVKKT